MVPRKMWILIHSIMCLKCCVRTKVLLCLLPTSNGSRGIFSAARNDNDSSVLKKIKRKEENKEQESLIQLSLSHVNSCEFPESNVFMQDANAAYN